MGLVKVERARAKNVMRLLSCIPNMLRGIGKEKMNTKEKSTRLQLLYSVLEYIYPSHRVSDRELDRGHGRIGPI